MIVALVAMNYHFVGDTIAGSVLGAIVGVWAASDFTQIDRIQDRPDQDSRQLRSPVPSDPQILPILLCCQTFKRPHSAVIAPYVSGRRSRKNCQVLRTSRIMSRSMSAITMSSSVRFVDWAMNWPRGSQK